MITRRIRSVTSIFVLLAVYAQAPQAHEMYRVVGTILSVGFKALVVTQIDGDTISMTLDENSRVTRDKKPVPLAELSPGLTVVVDGFGDSLHDLTVRDVMIVPPLKKKK
jgi:hypothetical protein